MGRLSAILIIAPLLAAAGLPSLALSCEPIVEPSVLDAANRPVVKGLVERETIAANPLPWGRSVAAATRVWGDVSVERWQTTGRKGEECPRERYRERGVVEYDYVAPPEAWEGRVDGTIEVLDIAVSVVLEQRFGAPVVLDVTAWDRTMAWGRVFPSALVSPVIAGLGIGALWRRRRNRPDYLF